LICSYDQRGGEERHWADPQAGGRTSLHQEEEDRTFILNINNLTKEDRGLYRYN
jgi:hypothetical protein